MEEQIVDAESESTEKNAGLGNRILRVFVRILLVVILGTIIGVILYLGVPALYREWIEPIQAYAQRIDALEEDMAQFQVDMRTQRSTISTDLAEIEGGLASQHEDIAELQALGETMGGHLEAYSDEFSEIPSLIGRMEELEKNLDEWGTRLDALEQALQDEVIPTQHLERQIQLLCAMEWISRARLWMIQGNFGMAEQDIVEAKEILEVLDADAMEGESLTPMIERLDEVLVEIELRPVIAANDLEIVWQFLLFATAP
jgi:chromosome segregation ATPase